MPFSDDNERPKSRLEELDEGCFAHLPSAGDNGEYDPDSLWEMLIDAGVRGRPCPEDSNFFDAILPRGWRVVTDDLGNEDTGRSLANEAGIVVVYIVQTTHDPDRFMLVQP